MPPVSLCCPHTTPETDSHSSRQKTCEAPLVQTQSALRANWFRQRVGEQREGEAVPETAGTQPSAGRSEPVASVPPPLPAQLHSHARLAARTSPRHLRTLSRLLPHCPFTALHSQRPAQGPPQRRSQKRLC